MSSCYFLFSSPRSPPRYTTHYWWHMLINPSTPTTAVQRDVLTLTHAYRCNTRTQASHPHPFLHPCDLFLSHTHSDRQTESEWVSEWRGHRHISILLVPSPHDQHTREHRCITSILPPLYSTCSRIAWQSMLDISDRERQSAGRSELCGTPPSPSTHRSFTLTLHSRSSYALGFDSDRLTYQKSDDNPSFVFPWQAVLADLEEKLRELKDKKNTMRKRCRLRNVVLLIDCDWVIICLWLSSSISRMIYVFDEFDFSFLFHLLSSKCYIVEWILVCLQT